MGEGISEFMVDDDAHMMYIWCIYDLYDLYMNYMIGSTKTLDCIPKMVYPFPISEMVNPHPTGGKAENKGGS
jgi:hypothetical protein